MSDYSVLLERPLSPKEVFSKVKKIINVIFISSFFLFLLNEFIWKNEILHFLYPFFYFLAWLSLIILSIVNVLTLTERDIYDIYDTKKYINLNNIKTKTGSYLKLSLLRNLGLWFYPLMAAICLIIGTTFISMETMPFTKISIQTIALFTLYISFLYPIQFVFKRYKSMILSHVKNSSSNIYLSSDFIKQEIKQHESYNSPLNLDLIKINIENIVSNTKETSEIDKYFEENDNPPSIIDFIRFAVPAIATLFLSEVVPALKDLFI